MDLEQIGINAENWIDAAQDRDYWKALMNAELNFLMLDMQFFQRITRNRVSVFQL